MTDPYIAQVAADQRIAARQMLDWQLDHLRLAVGLVEVVTPDRETPLRTLRRTRRLLDPETRKTRFLPNFDGTGYLIRDTERSA